MNCIICNTEFIPNENGECSYCASEKKALQQFKKSLPLILSESNYFSPEANQEYMSVSQYKDFCKCEAMAMAKIHGEYEQKFSTALMVGSYVDAHFEGTLDVFCAKHPEIFLKSGKNAGGLKADYAKADEIIQRIEADPLFMEYMAGEKQVIITGEFAGAKWKCKLDSYFPKDKIVDLKCMRSLERIMGKSLVEHWDYTAQGAIYSYIEGNSLPFFLAIATKETVTDIKIVEINPFDRAERLEQIAKDMPRIIAVKGGDVEPERCGVCDYCKATQVLTGPIDSNELGLSNRDLKVMRGEM